METWYMAGALAIIAIGFLVSWRVKIHQIKQHEARQKRLKREASKAKRSASAKAAAARKVDLPMTEEQMARAQNMGMSSIQGIQSQSGNGQYGRSEL